MNIRKKDFPKTMDAVLKRARAYLEDEIGATFVRNETMIGNIDILDLKRITIIVGTGGPVNLLIAFCFDQSLLERLFHVSTAKLGIEPHERELFLRETAAETVNFILGHATADLAEQGNDVSLSPPVVLEEGRCIHRPRKATFATIQISTSVGILDIYFIGPSELFDHRLNVLSEEGGTCIR
ncbi:chemotaxis protein CheX [Magnetospirillum sp. SS-4]|uniref:chemotaxis protein CheX n=1 Tax=Magnetospirillum sp. SS-4 TaxID=2681465 RepID=UPI001380B9DD|nr:chemotaxis protein CheX [Magnetospirillum sp. SS-4]CAA7624655.1 conserved hypothetical protein [Magnetospirillum sp. SS-4]